MSQQDVLIAEKQTRQEKEIKDFRKFKNINKNSK